MSTRAIQFLTRKEIPFEVVKYEHDEKGAEFAARATGFPLDQTVKTLVVEMGVKSYCLVLLPGNRQLDLKRLAQVLGVKRVAMADAATAERLTGYLVGGISPFGSRQALPIVVEDRILRCEKVLINAGQRGTMLKMAPADILNGLGGRVEEISR